MCCLRESVSETMAEGSTLEDFYRGQHVLLTGATGFMGKVAMEKLLRSSDLETIYLLIRTKKGVSPADRFTQLFGDPLFGRLRTERPDFLSHVRAIAGDVAEPNLGMSDRDWAELTEKLTVVIHGAATVRFDEALDVAKAINVNGTESVVKLARACRRLKVFIYVSTAYSHCYLRRVEERLYDTSDPFENLCRLPKDKLVQETRRLLNERQWPNTYTYTKALAEEVVRRAVADGLGDGVSTVVFRPAIVASTAYEPLPGWIDNVYGPTGAVVGAAVGLIRTLHVDSKGSANIVPVDMVCNALLASAQEAAKTPGGLRVYNYVSSVEKPLTWGEFMDSCARKGIAMPPAKSMWVYSLTLHKTRFMYLLYVLFLHFLPALIADVVCIITKKRTRLLTIYKKIFKFSNVISYFSLHKWDFSNDNVQNLWRRLDPSDKKKFRFSIADLDWESYFYDYISGCRYFIIKEDPKTIPEGRILWRKLLILHITLKLAFWALVAYVVWQTVAYVSPISLWKSSSGYIEDLPSLSKFT